MKNPENMHIYFLPKKLAEQSSVIHASCYRLSLSMLRRALHEPVAVPIDSLNHTALITDSVIYFADNTDNHTQQQETGCLIKMSWHLHLAEARDVKEQHIPMKIVFYDEGLQQLQQQLTGEFYKALMLMDESYRNGLIPSGNILIKPCI